MLDEERLLVFFMCFIFMKDFFMLFVLKFLLSVFVDEKKKKVVIFWFFKGDEKCKLCNLIILKLKNGLIVKGKFCFWC